MKVGKVGVIKSIGEKPIFCLLDAKGNPAIIIPDFTDWMLEQMGKTVTLLTSEDTFAIVPFK